jgi:hypothetical protein
MNVTPSRTARAIAVGCTGCGKSTLEKAVLYSMPYVLAIDPKPSLGLPGHLPGFQLCRTPMELRDHARRGARWLQYRPELAYQNEQDYDRVLLWAFRCGNRYIAIDEAYLIHNRNAGPGLMACVTSGREKGIGMFVCTQRPCGIDQRLISEAEFAYVFELRKPEDRERMADCTGHPELEEPATGHQFWFARPGQGPVLTALDLNNVADARR